jgi:hypothetical protein
MSVTSAHARYRDELAALADEEVVALAAEAAAVRWGWPGRRAWTRMHERFEPDREPYATCVLAADGAPQRIVRLEAFREGLPRQGDGACIVGVAAVGHLRVTAFPSDPQLPTLDRALAENDGATVVRYRPGKRCTLRVERAGRVRFAKVYEPGAAEAAHADARELWQARRRGELGFRVSRPGRFDPGLQAVWHGGIAGEPVRERLRSGDGEELAGRLGRAAGTLQRATIRPRARRGRRAEFERTRRRCAELERRVPELGEEIRRLLGPLEALFADARPSQPRPVHGALHASQWLDGDEGVVLLDYDGLALGDPELDAATFLADLDVENRERVSVERLGASFLAGFEETAGPLDPRLLTAYRSERRLEKAVRVARALRPDGDRKAARRLGRALECLGDPR